jgi:hypothetical protein
MIKIWRHFARIKITDSSATSNSKDTKVPPHTNFPELSHDRYNSLVCIHNHEVPCIFSS